MKNRTLQYKIMVAIFALLFLIFLCGNFATPKLSETAVITAVGVEKAENDEFLFSFIIEKVGRDTHEYNVVKTTAKTVAGGLERLETEYGLTLKLSFLSLCLVDKEVANGEIFSVISFFLNTSGVHDSAELVIAQTPPSEIFSQKSIAGETGYQSLKRVLKISETTPISAHSINLKDFTENYFSTGKDSVVPLVGIEKTNEESKINLTSACLFKGDQIVSEISSGELLAYNVLSSNAKNSSFNLENVTLEDIQSDIRLTVVSSSCKIEKSIPNITPNLNINCKIKVGLLDQSVPSKTVTQVCGIATAKSQIATAVENYVASNMNAILNQSFATNADPLGIGENLSRSEKSKFQTLLMLEENYLKNATANINIQVEVLQNHRL
ncbi:MAG: Ger(x)C family spore germination C-terminal domain-containing protein [Bacillota bacterium]